MPFDLFAFVAGLIVGAVVMWLVANQGADETVPDAEIDPASAGGPRPKPAGTDAQAQSAGGPRPKV